MADTDIIVSEMTQASQINTGDLMIMTQPDAQAETGYTTKSGTVLQVTNKQLKGIDFPTDLPHFTNQNVLGGLEELKSDIKSLLPIATAIGNPCNFETGITDKLVSLKAAIVATGGNGTPSTPIPIVGHSELNLVRSGKNLIDVTELIVIDTGVTSDRLIKSFEVVAGVTYTLSCMQENSMTSNTRNTLIVVINGDSIYESPTTNYHLSSGIHSLTFTPSASGVCQIRIWGHSLSTQTTYGNFQLEVGSQATAYEPYNGQTFTIDLGGTRYGGYVDAVRGKLVVDYVKVALSTLTLSDITKIDAYPGLFFIKSSVIKTNWDMVINSDTVCICDEYVYSGTISGGNADAYNNGNNTMSLRYAEGDERLYIRNDNCSTVADLLTALANANVVYPLATPIEIDVSSISVEAVSGVNNIVSDGGGDVEVQYRDSIQHYIDSKIASVQALIL